MLRQRIVYENGETQFILYAVSAHRPAKFIGGREGQGTGLCDSDSRQKHSDTI